MHDHPRGEIICCDIFARERAARGVDVHQTDRRTGRKHGRHQPHGARSCANIEDQAALLRRRLRRQKHGVMTGAMAASLQQLQAPIQKSISAVAAHPRENAHEEPAAASRVSTAGSKRVTSVTIQPIGGRWAKPGRRLAGKGARP